MESTFLEATCFDRSGVKRGEGQRDTREVLAKGAGRAKARSLGCVGCTSVSWGNSRLQRQEGQESGAGGREQEACESGA